MNTRKILEDSRLFISLRNDSLHQKLSIQSPSFRHRVINFIRVEIILTGLEW
jgi:hypothetical protein